MLFAGSNTLKNNLFPGSAFLLVDKSSLACLAAARRRANPAQHGPAASTATPGTSWRCQVIVTKLLASLHNPPAVQPTSVGPALAVSVRDPLRGWLASISSFLRRDRALLRTRSINFCCISATSIDVKSFFTTSPVLLLKTDSRIRLHLRLWEEGMYYILTFPGSLGN